MERTSLLALINRSGLTVYFTRHHWVLLDIQNGVFHVYDSAVSRAVRQDITKLTQALSLPLPVWHTCPQQKRGSNECGLFVILNALILRSGLGIPEDSRSVSLAALRGAFPDAGIILALGRTAYGLAPLPHATHTTRTAGAHLLE